MSVYTKCIQETNYLTVENHLPVVLSRQPHFTTMGKLNIEKTICETNNTLTQFNKKWATILVSL